MELFMHNFTVTPAVVTQVVHLEDRVSLRRINITEKGIYTPVTGLLKVGTFYPTPWGKLPIRSIGNGCIQF